MCPEFIQAISLILSLSPSIADQRLLTKMVAELKANTCVTKNKPARQRDKWVMRLRLESINGMLLKYED